MKVKLTSRDMQAAKTKNRIYESALDVLEKKGFINMTIADICKAAGVSVGSFYHHFSSKNDILLYHLHLFDESLQRIVIDCPPQGTAQDKILQFFEHYSQGHVGFSIELNKQWYSPVGKLFVGRDRPIFSVVKDIVSEGQREGVFVEHIPSDEITEFIFILARGVVLDWLYNEGKYDLSKRMSAYLQQVLPTFEKQAHS